MEELAMAIERNLSEASDSFIVAPASASGIFAQPPL
jgi:hypothetical protein